MLEQDLEQLRQQLLDKDFNQELLEKQDLHPSQWAELILSLPEEDRLMVLSDLSTERQTDVFPYLSFEVQKMMLDQLKKSDIQYILNHLESDDRTELLEKFPPFLVTKYIDLLFPDKKNEAQTFLGYQEDSIGRLMSTTYIALKSHFSIPQSIEYIQKYGVDHDALNVIYIIDKNTQLIGEMPLRKLLLADPKRTIEELRENIDISLQASNSQEVAIQAFKHYDDRVSIPVVNENNVLLGIVTFDDVFHAAEEEHTEDIQKFGGLEALDYPYVATPFWELIRKRAGWLVILLFGEMLTTSAMAHYEDQIQQVVLLSFFVPLIISSGGNSGSQAATLIIRALALGEINLKSWRMVFLREFLSGIILGIILGGFGFLRIAVTSTFSTVYGEHWLLMGYTIFFSLIGVVIWGTISGAMLPFFLKKIGADPATSSAPFVATICDVTGIVIYFVIATLILQGVLM